MRFENMFVGLRHGKLLSALQNWHHRRKDFLLHNTQGLKGLLYEEHKQTHRQTKKQDFCSDKKKPSVLNRSKSSSLWLVFCDQHFIDFKQGCGEFYGFIDGFMLECLRRVL